MLDNKEKESILKSEDLLYIRGDDISFIQQTSTDTKSNGCIIVTMRSGTTLKLDDIKKAKNTIRKLGIPIAID